MRRTIPALASALALVLAPALTPDALAGEPRTHDGFFLRLSGGFGHARTSIDLVSEFEVRGATGDLNLAVGGMVAPNLALHGTIFGWSAADPDLEWTGVGSAELNGDVTLSAVGVGLTYYVMPANLYLSGSVGAGTLKADISGGLEGETDTGVIVDLTVGKEWWTGNSWGLGLAGDVMLHSLPEKGIDESWGGASVGIRFSATLN